MARRLLKGASSSLTHGGLAYSEGVFKPGVIGAGLLLAASCLAQGTGVIRGSIVATGTVLPVAGANIVLTEDMGMPASSARRYQGRTDRDGHFEFAEAPITRYRWSVTANGYKAAGGALTVTGFTTSLPIEMDKLGSISGRVLGPDGRPATGVTVSALLPWRYEISPPVSTDSTGRFTVSLPPGRYFVVAHPGVRKPGRTGWLNAFYPNSPTRNGAQAVLVRSGEDVSGLDLRIREEASVPVTGQVVNSGDRPVPNATVSLQAADAGLRYTLSASSDEQGRYSFTGVPNGNWHVSAEISVGTVPWKGAAPLTVADRPVENVRIRLLAPFSVSGTVTYATPTGNTGVFLLQETATSRSQYSAMTRETGRFSIPSVYPGRYRIVPAGKPPGQYVASVRLGNVDVMGREVSLTGNDPPIAVEYTNNGGIVKGSVRDGQRGYVVLVPVDEKLRDSVFIETVFSDTEGRFEFLGVRPGDYYGFAFPSVDVDAFADPTYFQQLQPSGASIRVAAGESQVFEPVLTKWPW
ncbi:MAG: hypothetical protein JWN34_2609 [Bryobacterales bacterium]|nr:hypothetical protein [Bryobacterales bacterium]